MIVNKLQFHFFKRFKDYSVNLEPLVFIKGRNGSGKSTISKDAIFFLLHGYSQQKIADIPTRNQSKSCWVKGNINHKGNNYEIKRSIPTKLEIKENGKLLNFTTNAEDQRYLNRTFGDLLYFKKFRMIDNSVGINFLE